MSNSLPPVTIDASRVLDDAITREFNRQGPETLAAQLDQPVTAAAVALHGVSSGLNAFAVIVLDLDHFERVKNQFGLETGNLVLQALVALIRPVLRQQDRVSRRNGASFCVFLPGANAMNAARVAERILAEFNATPIVLADLASMLSLSAGGADSAGSLAREFDGVLDRAQRALESAKAAGCNRVEMFMQPDT